MKTIDRRSFLKDALVSAAAVSLSGQQGAESRLAAAEIPAAAPSEVVGIIDTNVNLFDWPFRALKYGDTAALVAKLRKHRIVQAWAGSYEALFSKDLSGVNDRLAAECLEHGPDFLIPFGSVNPAWPDWEEEVRRCHEIYRMPGIRVYPGYQPFDLNRPEMESLVRVTAERKLILQVVFGMEDPRVHHPILRVAPVALSPLLKSLNAVPKTKLQLLHFPGSAADEDLGPFMAMPNTFMDISHLEGNGAVGRMIGTITGLPSARVSVERIVFGSHAPYFPVETALLKLIESPLNAQQLRAIMQDNARRYLPQV